MAEGSPAGWASTALGLVLEPRMTAYGDPDYRAARVRLAAGAPCWKGCGRAADTLDHVPALACHDHQRGTGCCVYLPCCQRCNSGAGARLRNSRRHHRPNASRSW